MHSLLQIFKMPPKRGSMSSSRSHAESINEEDTQNMEVDNAATEDDSEGSSPLSDSDISNEASKFPENLPVEDVIASSETGNEPVLADDKDDTADEPPAKKVKSCRRSTQEN
jgi:hypothetical protein